MSAQSRNIENSILSARDPAAARTAAACFFSVPSVTASFASLPEPVIPAGTIATMSASWPMSVRISGPPPAMSSGGHGFCTVFGRHSPLVTLKYVPSKSTCSSLKSRFISLTASARRATRTRPRSNATPVPW